jgi:hypothetical protein
MYTRAGTRPGDCFADIIFGYAWACVLKKLEQHIVDTEAITYLELEANYRCRSSMQTVELPRIASSSGRPGWTTLQFASNLPRQMDLYL